VAPSVAPNALWLVSEFATPCTFFGRTIASPLVASLYFAFRSLTGLNLGSLPDHSRALASAGWSMKAGHSHLGGLLISQIWQPRHHDQP
jgi:hypothetical protein